MYDCDASKCAQNEELCESYRRLNNAEAFLKKMRQFKLTDKIKRLKDFVRPCEAKPTEFNVCLNIEKCTKQKGNSLRHSKNCRCTGKYSFKCGGFFCSKTKKDCELFVRNTTKTELMDFKTMVRV